MPLALTRVQVQERVQAQALGLELGQVQVPVRERVPPWVLGQVPGRRVVEMVQERRLVSCGGGRDEPWVPLLRPLV